MNKKSVTKVFLNQRKALRLSGDTHRALKVAPWLISAAAAWLTFAPCGTALAAHAWKSDGSSALNGTLSFENTINPAERNKEGELPASWTKNGGDAKGQVELTGVRGISENIYGALVESGKGNAYESSVSITGRSSVRGSAVGALLYSGIGDAHNNRVNVVDESRVEGAIYGAVFDTSTGDAYTNTVVIKENSSVTGQVFGAALRLSTGNAYNNTVTIDHAAESDEQLLMGSVTGAVLAESTGDAHNNTVKLYSSPVKGAVTGGAVITVYPDGNKDTVIRSIGDAYANTVALDKSVVGGVVVGGLVNHSTGNAYKNAVRISGDSAVNDIVYGGYLIGSLGKADRNDAIVSGGKLAGGVYGGLVEYTAQGAASTETPDATADHNTVTLSGVGVKTNADTSLHVGVENEGIFGGCVRPGEIYPGISASADANAVSLSRVSADGVRVYGGLIASGSAKDSSGGAQSPVSLSASGNNVFLEQSSAGDVYGGIVKASGSAQSEATVTAEKNTVVLAGGSSSGGSVYGGSVSRSNTSAEPSEGTQAVTGRVSGNTVRIEGNSPVTGSVYGGYTENGTAEGNFVYVDGTVRGGVEGGHTLSGDASGNTVVMEGGTVFDRLYGGYTGDGSASSNSITVTAGRVRAAVVGGYDDGSAVNNTVTLYGTASFAGSDLYGGRSGGTSSDVFTGNTLNLHGQIQADSLQNFQNLNFSDVAEGTPSADLAKSAVIGDGKGSFTSVSIQSLRNQPGNVPEEYVLVHTPTASSSFSGTNLYVNGASVVTIGSDGSYVPYAGAVSNDGTMDNETGTAGMTSSQSGLSKGFLTFDVDYFIKNGQDLIARWKKNAPVEVDPETEQFSATRQASAALMDEGADFVAGEGIDRALQASQCLPGEPCGAKAFMAVNGGYSTFKAGTTITMGYGNLVAGLARQCKIGPMGYLAGAFFETGLGRFHSEYETDNSRAIDSEGHDYYYGVGALAKVFLNRDALRGLYAEGSIRYGLMMSDWQSHDINISGRTADWDGRAPYLTAHGGLGYMWDVTDNVTADVYAKYFWGHLWGDDGTICGQKFEFDDIYSSRVRTGARLNFKKDETFSWYLGGAWEHQFDAKSTGSIYGYDVPSTDLRGNTAIAEAGIYFRPKADSDFSFMLGTTGYFGEKREGVTGHLQVRYEF